MKPPMNLLFRCSKTQYPRFTATEEAALAHRSKQLRADGRPTKRAIAAQQQLLLSITPWAIQLAKRFFGQGIDNNDVISAAIMGALKAVHRFNPSRGRLTTYSMRSILQACRREIWKYAHPITLPGSQPTEMPAHLQEKAMRVQERCFSIDNMHFRLCDHLQDAMTAECRDLSDLDIRRLTLCRGWMNTALNERDRDIVWSKMRGETLASIGGRYGISGERARQIVVKSVSVLREVCTK